MPSRMLCASVVATKPLLPALPDIPNLLAWSYFGQDLAHSQNASNGSSGAFSNLFAASPTYSPAYARFQGTIAGLKTTNPINPGSALTFMSVSRYITPGSTSGAAAVIWTPNSGGGATLSVNASSFTLQANGMPGTQNLGITGGNFNFLAFTSNPGAEATLYNLTDNTNIVAGTGTVAVVSSLHNVGAASTGTNDRIQETAFVCFAGSLLDKPTLDKIAIHVRAMLKIRGFTFVV